MFRSDKPLQETYSGHVLGIHLSGEALLVVYGNLNGMVYERLAAPISQEQSFPAILELIMVQADKLLTLTQAQHLPIPDRVSVAISGDFDEETGVLKSALDFPQWRQEPVRSQLSVRFNLPVSIEQKANAGALAEYYFGAGQKAHDFVFISMDPEIRVGILTDGQVYHNSAGTAGQLGNFPLTEDGPAGLGRPGSLNGYASARGMLELAHLRYPNHWNPEADLFKVISDAKAGDLYAQEVFQEAGTSLGRSLVGPTFLLRPEMIIIGFPGCLLEELLLKSVRSELAKAARLDEAQLPLVLASPLCTRLPELEAIAPAVHQQRRQQLQVK